VHPAAVAAGLIPVVIVLVWLRPFSLFFRETRTPDPVAWAFLGFLIACFVLLPTVIALLGFLRSRRGATLVTVSTEGIVIESRGVWRTHTTASHAASEILDVDFSTTHSATASARQAAREAVGSAGSVSGTPVIGPRTERWLVALSRFAKGRGITVKARGGLTTFGQGLDDEEIRYLHAIVRRALAGDT
jgi:hypothetical protein